jgi:hypothetical protein
MELPFSPHVLPERVPAIDIARWLARLRITGIAFEEARPMLFYEGQGDSGQSAWVIAEHSKTIKDVEAHYLFEEEVLRGLYGCMPTMHDQNAVSRVSEKLAIIDDVPEDINERATTIKLRSAQVGLGRLGLIEQVGAELVIPPVAYAALAHYRADIRNPYDRELYSREVEIDPFLEQLLIDPRKVDTTSSVATPGEKSQTETVKTMSRYRFITSASKHYLAQTGFGTRQQAWWNELNLDLTRIDSMLSEITPADVNLW